MELKSPKAKKKSPARVVPWKKMSRTPLLVLLLLGTSACDNYDLGFELGTNSSNFERSDHRLRHKVIEPSANVSVDSDEKVLSDIKYFRRHLNRAAVNFVMRDVLVDGEVENRVHYDGVTAKETFVGVNGSGLKLRQLTDGRHLIQVIYTPDGAVQDCEYITEKKSVRNFLRTLRKELKLALDEESLRISERGRESPEDARYLSHFGNVTFRFLNGGEKLPPDVASWLNYDRLKRECIERHKELTYMMEYKNKVGETSLARSRRSFRENFILPGTKWCGAGQLAERYNELGASTNEDRCCRAHDNCRVNIGAFRRKFGLYNHMPFTISHCRCDRRFRACLKLADTSVSNMVGKLFFNIIQTQCFILKPMKVCTERSWWGKCLRKERKRQAFLRNNLSY